MLSNEKMLTLLTKTTESSARLAGTKRNIHELFDDLTLALTCHDAHRACA